jgi:hypothetical protein
LLAAPALLLFLSLAARRAFAGGVSGAGDRGPLARILASIRAQPELAASAVAYFVWAALGQNTAYKPRHWLPLAPLLIVAVATSASALTQRTRARWAAIPALVLAGQWLVEGASLARAHVAPSPAAAIVGFLERARDEDRRPVVTADLARMIAERVPQQRVLLAPHADAVVAAVLDAGPEGALITSEALHPSARAALERRGYTLTVLFTRPRSRYIDSLWSELALVEARAEQQRSPAADY